MGIRPILIAQMCSYMSLYTVVKCAAQRATQRVLPFQTIKFHPEVAVTSTKQKLRQLWDQIIIWQWQQNHVRVKHHHPTSTPASCLLVTFKSSAISFVLITFTIKGPRVCIIHDTAVPMSEIKCNKLEITSLRQCDSIKIQGNIGPCIIERPARQDSCQACQTCCND